MATTITPPAASPEPSIADLRAMLADDPAPVVTEKAAEPITVTPAATEAKTETSDTTAATERPRGADGKFIAKEQTTEAESGTAQIQEPEKTVEVDEPLPKNVQKRIAREVERQAQIDREINEQVSRTKARQDQLDKLKASDTGKTGSEPAPTTAPAKDTSKPVEPELENFATFAEFKTAEKKFKADHEAWLLAEADRKADERWEKRQAKESSDRALAEAVKAHGEGWNEARERVQASTPEGLQMAISAMGDWSALVAHLGKPENAAELEALSKKFAQNPYAAVAELGRLEDRLKTPVTQPIPAKARPQERILPPPPEKIGGAAGAQPAVNFEKADMSTFKREIQSHL